MSGYHREGGLGSPQVTDLPADTCHTWPQHPAFFVLQLWASQHPLTASTLAYTITTALLHALRLEACSMPWPGRLTCWHLLVVCIFYIKGSQKLMQPHSLWTIQAWSQLWTPCFVCCKICHCARVISVMASDISHKWLQVKCGRKGL